MALSIGELVGYLKLDDSDFNRGLGSSERRMGAFGGFVAKAAKIAGAAVVGGIAAAAVGGVKQFASLEKGMNEVFTLMPGISEQAMGKMTGQVKDFSVKFGVLPDEVVPALYQSLSAGVPPGNVFDFLETAQKAAKGGVTDLTTAVDGISSVTNAYGEDVVSATKASDLMFTAVRLGKTNFEELSGSLYNVIPTASALGVEFGDVTAAIASMTAQGTPTSVATTQMRQMLVELSKDGSKTSETFKEIAGVGFKEFVAGGGDVQGALKLMEGEAKKSGKGINDLFGSVEAGSAALALTGKGAAKFDESLKGMQDSAGATDAAFEQMDQGLVASWEKIKAAGAVALVDIGEALSPMVADFASWGEKVMPKVVSAVEKLPAALDTVKGALENAQAVWEDNKTTIKVIAGIIATLLIPHYVLLAVAAVKTAATKVAAWALMRASAIATVAKTVWATGVMAAKFAWLAAKAMASALRMAASWIIAMGPVGWVIAAVVALGVIIWKNWDKIKKWTTKAWEAVSKAVASAWEKVKAWVAKGVAKVKALAASAWEWIRTKTVGAWDKVKSAISTAWDRIKSLVSSAISRVVGFVGRLATIPGKMRDWFGRAKDAAVDKLTGLVDWLKGLPGKILSAVGNLGGVLKDAGKAIMQGLLDGINAMWETVKGKFSDITKMIPKLKGPMAVDSKLLTPNGAAIMQGLRAGIESQVPALQRTLGGITAAVPDMAGGAGSRGRDVYRERIVERHGPMIGQVNQQSGESADVLAERLWFKTRTRG